MLILLALTAGLLAEEVQIYVTKEQRIAGAGLLAFIFIVWLIVQRVRDRWLVSALERIELSDEATFYLLYNNSPVAHMVIKKNGEIVDFNPATVQLLKDKLSTLRGRSFFSLLPPDFDASILAPKVEAGLTLNELELPLVTPGGIALFVLMSVSSLGRRGELLVTLIDITDKKKVDTAKSEFVALATHQLRTPIAAIRYAAELLGKRLGDGASERNVAYLNKVNRNVVRMLALINDFLNVSKLEMGTFATEAKSVNLSEFMNDILDEFSDRIARQKLEVARRDTPNDFVFMTDPRLLNIILSNLVSNAVKYTPEGGKLELTITGSDKAVQFEVMDSGIGIPAEEIPQLFNKFFRASNARSIQSEGTGLGLYIVEQAVEQLGGTISVASDTGEGSSFTVTLPVLRA